ncbi:unnamed protein product [Rotaria sp. Silwood1]|nr:unnamed protein product [Rotaria sp. Silwood1]
MLNNSIGAPTPKLVSSETTKTSVSGTNLIIPEWVHCEICKRREQNGPNNTRLPLGYCHPCGHIICRDCAVHNMNSHNLFDYQDAKWNQLIMHRIEYLRQMNKIKKGMMELEETKRINKELLKIFQGQEQLSHQNHERHQQTIRQYQSTISPARPSSVASSTSLNFGPQQRQQTNHNSSSIIKPMVIGTSPNPQHHHVPPPEPDKLMTYEQAMIYAHPALKDALRLAHRRKMSSKNSGTITPK